MIIQKKLEFDGQEVWLIEDVSPEELYHLIDRCKDVRTCPCVRCGHYAKTKSFYCMKHPSVCLK